MPNREQNSYTVSGTTHLYGIMGYPIAHSLSPVMQTFAFRHHGLDCVYVPFPVTPDRLADAVVGAVALGVCGLNVTIPHKEAIMAYLDEVSVEAQFIGAINTVVIREGRTIGYNTDGEGFLQPLRAMDMPFRDTVGLVLGAGGGARALTMALLEAGCATLMVVNRTRERAERLVVSLRERFPQAQIRAIPFDYAVECARDSTLIVNATSVGLHSTEESILPEACFRPEQVVYDIVYRPLYTSLLQAARRRGATVIPGIDMLIGQGAVAFQLWTGLPLPVAAVRRVLQPFLHTTS
jgi:shikimate dehydrogenase